MTTEEADLVMTLSEYGTVNVCNIDYVFTLWMEMDAPMPVETFLDITTHIQDQLLKRYPIIEVMRNTETHILIVLKPNKDDKGSKKGS